MSLIIQPLFPVYDAFKAADDAWQAELVRIYGKRACDVRYTAEGRGAGGPTKLGQLYAEFARCRDAWHGYLNSQLDDR